MPPDFEAGKTYRVTAVLTYDGVNEINNVYHLRADVTGSWVFDGVANAIKAWLNAMYLPIDEFYPASVQSQRIEFYNETDGYTMGEIPWTDFVGNISSEGSPPGVAMQLDLQTEEPRVRGRKYLLGASENQQSNGIWVPGAVTLLEQFLATLMSDITLEPGATMTAVVWSKKLLQAYEVVSGIVQEVVAYQRRRKQGSGS